MIKIALFDVGDTLIHDGRPFAGALDALAAIAKLKTVDAAPLLMGIVSDYYSPAAPTEAEIAELERRYRDEVLDPSGLSPFFQPFESRVTLSSRAGVRKPDRKIFELALQRSGTGATLDEILFVTENLEHLEKCKDLGITPVRFGAGSEPKGMPSFRDWIDAPAVIARLVEPGSPADPSRRVD